MRCKNYQSDLPKCDVKIVNQGYLNIKIVQKYLAQSGLPECDVKCPTDGKSKV